jgi:DNA ligase-1
LMSDSQMLIAESFKKRRWELEKIITQQPNLLELSDLIFEKDNETIKKFYQTALHEWHEWIMAKIPSSPYIFGRHVGSIYKIKPTMENLDLIVIWAYRWEGSRTQRLTSFELACLDSAWNYQTIWLMSTWFTEQEFWEITELLKPEIISQDKTYIKVNPKVIVEVSYQEIQESTNYSSWLALRFPAFLRFRFDKENPDTLERAIDLYKSQWRSG